MFYQSAARARETGGKTYQKEEQLDNRRNLLG